MVTHRVTLLVIVGSVPFPQLAESFLATSRRIFAFLEIHEPPMIAKVYRPSPSELGKNKQAPGRVELWYPKPRH